MGKKIYIICSVRGATNKVKDKLETYTKKLVLQGGHEVHLPHIHTDQDNTSIGICDENVEAIKWADEVHIFYDSTSTGSHFDMGVAFALGKPIKVIENESYEAYKDGKYQKSFPHMLKEWNVRSNFGNK
jgi:nucleoside 2-deoxyribosyltransferase